MIRHQVLIASAILAISSLAFADEGAPKTAAVQPAAPKASSSNPLQDVLPSWLQIGGSIRGRFEDPFGIGYSPDVSDAYYFSRARLDLQIRPIPQLRFYAQLQDGRAWGYNNRSAINSCQDPVDLRMGYAEFLSDEARGIMTRVGRQDMTLGAGRLIGSPDWSNVSRTYDAARLALYRPGVRVDLFAGSPVLIDPSRFDRHKPGEHVYGSYFTFNKLVPKGSLQPYLIARTTLNAGPELGKSGDAHLYTGGVRFEGKLPSHFDYSLEVARQWGPWSSDRISAFAGAYTLGWTAGSSTWKPRVSLDVSHASGDQNSKDGVRGTFDQLYASNHSLFGITDQSGWKNMRMAKVGLEVTPAKKLKAFTDFREIYLATVQDGFYAANGTRVALDRAATSRHVGSEVDLAASYQFSKVWSAGLGVGHIFAGAYLRQATKGGDYTYPYLMWTGKF